MSGYDDRLDELDDRILRGLREELTRLDPPPEGMDDRVRFALTVHALQAEVAELLDQQTLAVRGETEAVPTESVTFTAGTVSLMVSADPEATGRTVRLDGWVTTPEAEIEVVAHGLTVRTVADANGRFVAAGVPRGGIYFVVREPGNARPVITPTVDL